MRHSEVSLVATLCLLAVAISSVAGSPLGRLIARRQQIISARDEPVLSEIESVSDTSMNMDMDMDASLNPAEMAKFTADIKAAFPTHGYNLAAPAYLALQTSHKATSDELKLALDHAWFEFTLVIRHAFRQSGYKPKNYASILGKYKQFDDNLLKVLSRIRSAETVGLGIELELIDIRLNPSNQIVSTATANAGRRSEPEYHCILAQATQLHNPLIPLSHFELTVDGVSNGPYVELRYGPLPLSVNNWNAMQTAGQLMQTLAWETYAKGDAKVSTLVEAYNKHITGTDGSMGNLYSSADAKSSALSVIPANQQPKWKLEAITKDTYSDSKELTASVPSEWTIKIIDSTAIRNKWATEQREIEAKKPGGSGSGSGSGAGGKVVKPDPKAKILDKSKRPKIKDMPAATKTERPAVSKANAQVNFDFPLAALNGDRRAALRAFGFVKDSFAEDFFDMCDGAADSLLTNNAGSFGKLSADLQGLLTLFYYNSAMSIVATIDKQTTDSLKGSAAEELLDKWFLNKKNFYAVLIKNSIRDVIRAFTIADQQLIAGWSDKKYGAMFEAAWEHQLTGRLKRFTGAAKDSARGLLWTAFAAQNKKFKLEFSTLIKKFDLSRSDESDKYGDFGSSTVMKLPVRYYFAPQPKAAAGGGSGAADHKVATAVSATDGVITLVGEARSRDSWIVKTFTDWYLESPAGRTKSNQAQLTMNYISEQYFAMFGHPAPSSTTTEGTAAAAAAADDK